MKLKKPIITIASILVVFALAFIVFQVVNKTTFRDVLEQNISDSDEISRIVIEAKIDILGESMWTSIDDPQLIKQLLAEQSDISLKRKFTKTTRKLTHTMTIHVGSDSYFLDFDYNYFVANGIEYKVTNGDFISTISSLRSKLDWETDEEFSNGK